jgi:hypothetical protein
MGAAGIVVVLVFGVFSVGTIVTGIVRKSKRNLLLDLPALSWRVLVSLWLIIVAAGALPFLRFVPPLWHCVH